eukprot:1543694-Pleurochrysis_carterae.AAC.4
MQNDGNESHALKQEAAAVTNKLYAAEAQASCPARLCVSVSVAVAVVGGMVGGGMAAAPRRNGSDGRC